MFSKPLSSKVKDLAILSDRNNLKILCALMLLGEKTGNREFREEDLIDAASISRGDMSKFGEILNETHCIQIVTKELRGESPHNFYTITEYGKELLKMVGIDRRIIRNEIEKNSTSHD